MSSMIAAILLIVALGLCPPLAVFGVHKVLEPLVSAGPPPLLRAQFNVADCLCLFFLVQVTMAAVHLLASSAGVPWEIKVTMDLLSGIGAVVLWWTGVQALATGDVSNAWHRAGLL